MDHSAHLMMNQGDGHGNHGNHGDGSASTCTMHSALTWSYKDTCVVFSSWHIKTPKHLILSMFAIMLLAYFYEYLKYYIYKFQVNQQSSTTTNSVSQRRYNLANSIWYGLQVGFSFMLMLVFMTYNGWLMLSVVAGAIWGNYHWGSKVKSSGVQELSCH